jgi:hypothetical protein
MGNAHLQFEDHPLIIKSDPAATSRRKRIANLEPHAILTDIPAASEVQGIQHFEPNRKIDGESWSSIVEFLHRLPFFDQAVDRLSPIRFS